MSFLLPKKGWDYEDSTFLINGSFSSVGLHKYWSAIDGAIQFWNQKNKGQIVQFQSKLSNDKVKGHIKSKIVRQLIHKPEISPENILEQEAGKGEKSSVSPRQEFSPLTEKEDELLHTDSDSSRKFHSRKDPVRNFFDKQRKAVHSNSRH